MGGLTTILKSCEGVRYTSEEKKRSWGGQTYIEEKFFKTGDIKVPDELYIKITQTATRGTIAKVVDIEVQTYGERNSSNPGDQIVSYDATLIYESKTSDGKKKKGRINSSYIDVLVGTHPLSYVRNITKHADKPPVKNPVNKYKQELQRGDFVIGVKPGKTLGIGRITRWTNHNVWAVSGDDLDDKSAEFKFDSISETFTFPDTESVEELLTFAILSGWNGR